MRIELQRPNISGTPFASRFSLSIGFHNIRGLARRLLTIPSSRRLSRVVSPPTLVKRVSDESLTCRRISNDLCDVELKPFALPPYRQDRSQIFEKEWRGRTSGSWTSPM